ncbi:hypothetical protein Rumeso_00294 [Rubellimicrobium mesophilum DSM 19309]|uniref:Uncharacterized protein n=1 Tax=Rubellimicrobium mesophilum DSM 19309 TaxID=442562 RepID=A0A017HUR2_9RHOB|nr:hypothetical protein [Rubellimicrobium mesophilum]EYD78111.1 hypothetical protein Rumeso_00294 [Rubellimicrobium mesophilum DSM 19309]
MRNIAFVFFLAAVLCVTCGMVLGLYMAASENHILVGAHAHLNLAGWASLALFGLYYNATPQAAQGWLPRVHAVVAILGVLIMVPGIAIASTGGTPGMAIVGSLLVFASMMIFLVTVIRFGLGAAPAGSRQAGSGVAFTPAE